MITLEQAAQRLSVSANNNNSQQTFIDPLSLSVYMSIISILFSALKLWCKWKEGQKANGSDIQAVCRRPSFYIRRRVHRVVREQLGEDRYRTHGNELVAAIFKAGVDASTDELEYLADRQGQDKHGHGYVNKWGENEQEV